MQLLYQLVFLALISANWAYFVQNERISSRSSSEKSPSDLHRALFKNYDNSVRPVKKYTDALTNSVGFQPLYIREVDEEKEIMIMDAWLFMSWEDSYLTWNPDDYGGIKILNVPSSEVWKPDLTLYTASPDVRILPQVFTNVLINHTGQILWVPPMTISTRCPLDMTHYPQDTQTCKIKFGSWTFGKSATDLQLYHPFTDIETFLDTNPDWTLVGLTWEREDNYYPCCPNESYPSINVNITIKRKQSAPMELAQNVSYYACFLALLMFWLPPDSVYKVIIGAIAEALMGMAILYIGTVVPAPLARLKAAGRIYPMMCAVSAALIVEVIVMNLARGMGSYRPPRCLLAVAKSFCTPFCVCASKSSSTDDLSVELNYSDKLKKYNLSSQEEWNLVAMALDRILFILAFVIAVSFYKFW